MNEHQMQQVWFRDKCITLPRATGGMESSAHVFFTHAHNGARSNYKSERTAMNTTFWTLVALGAAMVFVLVFALAAVAGARENFEPYRWYGQREEDDYYGVPLDMSWSRGTGDDGRIRCDPAHPHSCPDGMRCSDDGWCTFECGPDGKCPGDMVCGPDGV